MIQFSKTTLGEEEKQAVADCIDSGWVVQGEKTKQFEEEFATYVGSKYCVFVDSCTSALELSIAYLKKDGFFDTLILPAFTFAATAETVYHSGIKIQWGDVNKETFCLKDVWEKTLPVNFGGVFAGENARIYDSAHRIEKDDNIRAPRALWCYSFYATKNMTTVQGGMVATNSKEAYEWLLLARDHGLTLGTKERYEGSYKQYDIEFVGWRKKADDFRAVIGIEQLKKLPFNTHRRNEIVECYNSAFGKDWKGNHLYPLLVEDNSIFMDYMFANNIQCAIHYEPLYNMTAYKEIKGERGVNTEFLSRHAISLPLHPNLSKDEVNFIIKTVNQSGMSI